MRAECIYIKVILFELNYFSELNEQLHVKHLEESLTHTF